ncbi:MAG TPA: hypothetical protein VNM47_06055 [Terriglobia bacterium]|nr:hypothetical protein [Terriglobia bacterium]
MLLLSWLLHLSLRRRVLRFLLLALVLLLAQHNEGRKYQQGQQWKPFQWDLSIYFLPIHQFLLIIRTLARLRQERKVAKTHVTLNVP